MMMARWLLVAVLLALPASTLKLAAAAAAEGGGADAHESVNGEETTPSPPVLHMVARHYYPAGYRNGTTSGAPDLYGYGFGALERSFYDAKQKIFYGGSEIGALTVTDFADYPGDVVVPAPFLVQMPDGYSLTDVKVCGDLLFVSVKDDPNRGQVLIYEASTRDETSGQITEPVLIRSVEVGYGPDNIAINKDCTIAATADEGEGDYDDILGLVNPPGSVTILRGPFDATADDVATTTVSLDRWSDDELIAMGVHLPVSLNALKYWDAALGGSAGGNFTGAIDSYTTASVLEPEYINFSGDESKLYVNLQENSALVVVDVATGVAESIHPYGLQDWGQVPVDFVEDGQCTLATHEGLYALRSPDGIATVSIDGVDYVITANEGDDVEYGDFAEKVKGGDIFQGAVLGFPNMTASESASNAYCSPEDAAAAATPDCKDGMSFTLGTAMVDYSNPQAPRIMKLVGLGSRGISIYKVVGDGDDGEGGRLELVWDSADQFERFGCQAFPWAHNSIQDEEFAPVGGEFYSYLDPADSLRETIEEMNDPNIDGCEDGGDGQPGACPLQNMVDARSLKDGTSPETVVVGEACESLYAVTVAEKSSIGFLYDLSNIAEPQLISVFHLSPVSKAMNPGLAYAARTMGEIDAESIQFLRVDQSPTGNAGVLFSGAFSGTTSFWEFNCTALASSPTGEGENSSSPEAEGEKSSSTNGGDNSSSSTDEGENSSSSSQGGGLFAGTLSVLVVVFFACAPL